MNHRTPQPARRTALRRAFTLLEVMLSLGLSVLLLAVIGMAVDFHLRLLQTGRAEVEQAQLARAILRRIADDLRNALQYTPSSTSSTSTSASSSSSTSSDSSAASTTTADGSTSESSDESMTEDQQMTDRTSNLASATSLPTLPGVYGNDHELQIDVSRLPRLDQMQTALSGEASAGSMAGTSSTASGGGSDLHTVLYYTGDSASAAPGPLASAAGAGLQRRDVDRITAALALQQGEGLQLQGGEESMAAEVQEIQFRYFDGTEWADTWDTTDRSGLPLAVYIGISLAAPQNSRRSGLWAAGGDEMDQQRRTYQLLVHLPAARATTSSSASGTDSTSSSSSTNASTSGTTNATSTSSSTTTTTTTNTNTNTNTAK